MSMKRVAMRITLPMLVNDFLHELMDEIGLNKSDLLESMVFYVSMPENLEEFKSQYKIGGTMEYEDEDENEDDDEDEANDPLGIFLDVDEDENGDDEG